MASIGDRLEEARKRAGVTIRDAAESTKIRSDFLLSFEANQFDFELPEVYKRGFLKLYARYLKIDEEKLIKDYNALILGQEKNARREARDHYGQMSLPENHPTLGSTEATPPGERRPGAAAPADPVVSSRNSTLLAWKIGIGVICFLAVLAIIFLLLSVFNTPEEPLVTDRPSSGSTTNTATQQQTQTEQSTGLITVRATEDIRRVLVRQLSDGQILHNGPLSRGQSLQLQRTGTVRIGSSSIEHTIVSIAGRDYPFAGSGPMQAEFGMQGPVQ
jgi:cytoskeletal protein RodZ